MHIRNFERAGVFIGCKKCGTAAVIVILDTCTFINLANGGVLPVVLKLKTMQFQLGSSVKRESTSVARLLDAAINEGLLNLVDDSVLSAVRFMALKEQFRLGDGETECILAAEAIGCAIACDDSAARSAVTKLFGIKRLTGSIGLLKNCVREGLLTSDEAFRAYLLMKAAGGFLPAISRSDLVVASSSQVAIQK